MRSDLVDTLSGTPFHEWVRIVGCGASAEDFDAAAAIVIGGWSSAQRFSRAHRALVDAAADLMWVAITLPDGLAAACGHLAVAERKIRAVALLLPAPGPAGGQNHVQGRQAGLVSGDA